jgi:CheY-like chemotaxis protein
MGGGSFGQGRDFLLHLEAVSINQPGQLKGTNTLTLPLKRILLVDDSPRDTELALDALAQHNLANEVLALRDGVEALDYLYRRGQFADRAAGQPAVVLLDLKMPKVGGLEVLRQMKSDPQLKMIPVVVLTSSREEQDLDNCYQLGANAYIVKPVGFEEFAEAVRQVGVFWAMMNEPPPGSARLWRPTPPACQRGGSDE